MRAVYGESAHHFRHKFEARRVGDEHHDEGEEEGSVHDPTLEYNANDWGCAAAAASCCM